MTNANPVIILAGLGLLVIALGILYLMQREQHRRPRRRRKPVAGGLLDRAKLRPAVHKTRVVPAEKVPELRAVRGGGYASTQTSKQLPKVDGGPALGAKPKTSQAERIKKLEADRAMLLELTEWLGYGTEAKDLLKGVHLQLGAKDFSKDEYRQHRTEEL